MFLDHGWLQVTELTECEIRDKGVHRALGFCPRHSVISGSAELTWQLRRWQMIGLSVGLSVGGHCPVTTCIGVLCPGFLLTQPGNKYLLVLGRVAGQGFVHRH